MHIGTTGSHRGRGKQNTTGTEEKSCDHAIAASPTFDDSEKKKVAAGRIELANPHDNF